MLPDVQWFTNVGAYIEHSGVVALRNLDAWVDTAGPANVADLVQWLPASRDDVRSIPGIPLQLRADGFVEEAVLRAYKVALMSLRKVPTTRHPQLRAGIHDFTPAARGAALVAVVQAVREIANDNGSFWRSIIRIYMMGHWPLGSLPSGELVVF